MPLSTPYYWGTGRRKTAIARVRLRPGEGQVLINGRPVKEYFPRVAWQLQVLAPLKTAGVENRVDVLAQAKGGGLTGQAGAVRLGIARALIKLNPDLRPALKKSGMLTRDPRMVERKKFGLRKARAMYQYSKR
ncbi:MAG TPA: 30S ribosomal protein S9 [Thermosynergistes sp.]|uniref:30S ribosomal protein S9 n=1 Tax=Acetomicrobium sp. S15 = DSM 107314 TaxID=2529858 RepID=UPI0018E1D711|nr:30S ribosomal protein S9 [Thermosynergistes sp.]